MERFARDKHTSFLQKFVNYGRKKFYNIYARGSTRAGSGRTDKCENWLKWGKHSSLLLPERLRRRLFFQQQIDFFIACSVATNVSLRVRLHVRFHVAFSHCICSKFAEGAFTRPISCVFALHFYEICWGSFTHAISHCIFALHLYEICWGSFTCVISRCVFAMHL